MERFKLGWRDPVAHRAQNSVTGIELGARFAPKDLHRKPVGKSLGTSITSAMARMNCVRKESRSVYKKVVDINNLLAQEKPPYTPEVCELCHYTKINPNNVQSAGCIILDDYRDKLCTVREGQEYSGPRAEIKVGLNGERKILVPFSQEETKRLQKMRELYETMGEETKVSGVMRQLLAVAKIPDGYALEDRNMAIEHMKELSELYRKALEDKHFTNSVAPFREKLTEINQGLRSFFEKN